MRDVAQAANVSVSTVSKALRNDPTIPDGRCRSIQEMAERLGYRPQDVAEDHRDAALAATAANPESEVSATFIGGMFCDMEFKGDLDRIR